MPASDISSTNSFDITEVAEVVPDSLSISAVLNYCKCKILHPYLQLLGIMALRPRTRDIPGMHKCRTIFSYVHLLQVLVLMCLGYILQTLSCFRRDRGFYYKVEPLMANEHKQICYGNLLFSYIIPSASHLLAYTYALYLFRIKENEQLQNLMERVFLLSSSPSDGVLRLRYLVRKLWLFIALSIVWLVLSLVSVNVMMADGTIIFHWFEQSSDGLKTSMKVLLVISTLWHDMAQATLITSYCLQGQLLRSHVHFLRAKILQHSISPLEWMREIGEFHKLLRYFNGELAPVVCLFTIVNVSWAASGIIWLLNFDSMDTETVPIKGISILNVLLWILIAVAPFVQAARLTNACRSIQNVGHEIRSRPFVYKDTPGEDLDTILLYTSSLHMTCKLFEVPITSSYLYFGITVTAIGLLILGQCHILQ